MQCSRLPKGGTNLFQQIKAKCAEAEKQGIKLSKLSIGQPTGPALLSARQGAAKAVMSEQESMHEYQDNGEPGVPDFAEKFVQFHVKRPLKNKEADYLPIPGIKPMLGLIPLACGANSRILKVATTTKPGYPTPKDWCEYLDLEVRELLLTPRNEFRFNIREINMDKTADLIMANYPHNPTGQVATFQWWCDVCGYCSDNNIRIFNDAAYTALSYVEESCTLTDVAVDFPQLSWAEAYSASKLIGNGTGWRIGAIVGSPDFVMDIKTIKGNTDSGFAAPMAAGVLSAIENDPEGIKKVCETYKQRSAFLIQILVMHGMRLAVRPGAGFFTLWKTPDYAFGEPIKNAEQFNFKMIERTGIVGVHFDPYIRYAVCGDIEKMAGDIEFAFEKAEISYR